MRLFAEQRLTRRRIRRTAFLFICPAFERCGHYENGTPDIEADTTSCMLHIRAKHKTDHPIDEHNLLRDMLDIRAAAEEYLAEQNADEIQECVRAQIGGHVTHKVDTASSKRISRPSATSGCTRRTRDRWWHRTAVVG